MTTSTSLFAQVIERAAHAVAVQQGIPAPNRPAYVQHVASILRAEFSALVGGERAYVPKVSDVERRASRQRILAALEAGEPVAVIAAREGATTRWVRKLRGTIRP